ncbi:hypothetical protein GCM10017781_34680 [Deinococcus metalli]|nr:hypothetical protein GCM10017781_34680 [Deinococcus metalli]
MPLYRSVIAVLTVLGALLGAGHAQGQVVGVLPLVSVGQKWPQAQESYVIRVSPQDAGKPIGLEVYSPTFNLADYVDGRRSAGYFGDELYKKNEVFQSTFTLSGPGGPVVERKYGMNREHTWESVFAGGLPAGTYTLKVVSSGDGKNSFALRVAAPFVLETSDFSVNARASEKAAVLAATLNVTPDWVGRAVALQNYDIDGPGEAETWVIQPGGARVNLKVSGNGETVTDSFTVTPALVGTWQIYIRVLPTTKQYSNAIRYSFRLDGQPVRAQVGGFAPPDGLKISNQLLVDVLDPQGQPIPGASYTLVGDSVVRPQLPPGYVPVSASIVQGSGNITSAAEVRFQPGFTKVRFVARPPSGRLTVDAVAIYGTQRIPLTGTPFEVAGRTLSTPGTVPLAPGDYAVKPGAVPGTTVSPPLPGHVTDSATSRVTIEYRVQTDITLVTSPDIVNACDVTQVTATARTDFPQRLPGRLKLSLPSGWSTDYPLEAPGEFSAGLPLRLKVPVRVCRSDSAEAILDPIDLRTTGAARVRSPGGSNVTRNVQGGARASLAKTLDAVGGGYTVTLRLAVDSALTNVRVIDPLPSGAARTNLSVEGPAGTAPRARFDGDAVVLAQVVPGTYVVTYTLVSDQPADRVGTVPDLDW